MRNHITPSQRKSLWLLGPYATAIHWCFEFVILTGVPVLALGAAISVADLMTGGLLSHLSEGFNLVWAIGQAAAIELLFFTAFMRVAEMAHQGRWGKVVGWLIVGFILAIPSFQASVVYGEVHLWHLGAAGDCTTGHLGEGMDRHSRFGRGFRGST